MVFVQVTAALIESARVSKGGQSSLQEELHTVCYNGSLDKTGKTYRRKITYKCVEIVVGFIDAFLDFPQHVSASNCHHQGGRSALEATQARSVMWMCVDYDSSKNASINPTAISTHLLVILHRYYKMLGPTIKIGKP
jgi:hypothetical protein